MGKVLTHTRTRVSAETILPERGTLFDLRSNMRRMPASGWLKKLCAAMRRLRRMPSGGQLRELRAAMRRLLRMPIDGLLWELCVMMCKLLWKMLHVLTFGCFCIPIGNKKRITQIVRLTRANMNSCWKSVAKKFETLIVKHVVPSMNWITQTKVGTKWSLWRAVNLTTAIVVFTTL